MSTQKLDCAIELACSFKLVLGILCIEMHSYCWLCADHPVYAPRVRQVMMTFRQSTKAYASNSLSTNTNAMFAVDAVHESLLNDFLKLLRKPISAKSCSILLLEFEMPG